MCGGLPCWGCYICLAIKSTGCRGEWKENLYWNKNLRHFKKPRPLCGSCMPIYQSIRDLKSRATSLLGRRPDLAKLLRHWNPQFPFKVRLYRFFKGIWKCLMVPERKPWLTGQQVSGLASQPAPSAWMQYNVPISWAWSNRAYQFFLWREFPWEVIGSLSAIFYSQDNIPQLYEISPQMSLLWWQLVLIMPSLWLWTPS